MKYRGCAYYPEYWGRERFETDARLMQEAGLNLARIGEFAWCRMEPREGEYTLDWLHECADVLSRHGVHVLMCTPTATPPAWLTFGYRDACLVRNNGVRVRHGSRRHYCPTSPTFREFSRRITTKLAQEMSRHANVIAWQLDNEFGPEVTWCYCPNCQERFRDWLKARYGTLDELNRRWGTGFWSMDYSDWSQVELSQGTEGYFNYYPSRNLDSSRFGSDMMIEFAMEQMEIIRRHHPSARITTNGMGPIFPPLDYYKLFDRLDVASDDLYFDTQTMDGDVLAMNVFRSIKPGRRYWITETGSGALDNNRPPHPDQFRAWAWSSLAHGGEAHVVFRWRTCLSGQEQELQGMLEHSGYPGKRYEAVKRCFLELREGQEELENLPLPEVPVAIVQDYDTIWGYAASAMGPHVDYLGLIGRFHKMLYDRNVLVDVVPPGRQLSPYKILILPSTLMISDALGGRLTDFVRKGGVLLAMGQVGMRDDNDNYMPYPGPDHAQDLFGMEIIGGMYLKSHVMPDETMWPGKTGDVVFPMKGRLGRATRGQATRWAADMRLRDGEVLMRFSGDAYDGQPAIVQKTTGKGTAVFVGALRVDSSLHHALIDDALDRAGIARGPATPEYVEIVRRGPVTFAVNHRAEPVEVEIGAHKEVLVGQASNGRTRLPAYGVCVVRT